MITLDLPVSDAYVILENVATGEMKVGKTDRNGCCRLHVEPGTYKLVVAHKEFMHHEETITVTGDVLMVIRLSPVSEYLKREIDMEIPETSFSIEVT